MFEERLGHGVEVFFLNKFTEFHPETQKTPNKNELSHLNRFRVDIFTAFFAKSTASQDLFKQSGPQARNSGES